MVGLVDKSYTYDELGRVATMRETGSERITTITYTEGVQMLVVDMTTLEYGTIETFPEEHWRLDFDEQGRLVRLATENGAPTVFTYGDGWFTERLDGSRATNSYYTLTATGQCEQPSISFAPSFDLPSWDAPLIRARYAPDYLLDQATSL